MLKSTDCLQSQNRHYALEPTSSHNVLWTRNSGISWDIHPSDHDTFRWRDSLQSCTYWGMKAHRFGYDTVEML